MTHPSPPERPLPPSPGALIVCRATGETGIVLERIYSNHYLLRIWFPDGSQVLSWPGDVYVPEE